MKGKNKMNKKILILGNARHGKDTLAQMITDVYGLTFTSSSMAAAKIFIYDQLKDKYKYETFEECYEDRMNHRAEWHDLICDYNKDNKAKLAKKILEKSDMYVGMRSNEEVEECIRQNLFDLIISVYDPRKPDEPKDSFNIDIWEKSDIIIYNNGTLDDLKRKVEKLTIAPKKVGWWSNGLKRVFFDLDGVCVDFEKHFLEYLDLDRSHPKDWNDFRFRKNFKKIVDDNYFWLTCPALIKPEQIAYPIAGYCTARPCSNEIVEQWLEENGFPAAEIINVGMNGNKAEVLKNKCEVMIDDSITNFVEINNGGIPCYLMTRPHNEKYNVGEMRVNSIEEFINKVNQY